MEVPDAFVTDVARRYGFAAGLKKARGDLLRKMRPHINELRKLYSAKDAAVSTAEDINELRKLVSDMNAKITATKKKMRDETVEERLRVRKFNAVVRHYDKKIINHLREMQLYREIYELDVEHEAIADKLLKEKQEEQKEQKEQKEQEEQTEETGEGQ